MGNTNSKSMKAVYITILMALALAFIPTLSTFATSYDGDTVAPDQNGNYTVNADAGDTVTLTSTGSAGGTLAVTFANGVSGGTITVTESTSVPAGASEAAPGTVGIYLDVDLSGLTNADVDSAVWTFTVTDQFLTDNGVSTDNIFLYHFTGGDWVAESTKLVSSAGGVHTFEATLTSFSPFAVTAVAGLTNTGAPIAMSLLVASGIIASLGGIFIVNRKSAHKS